MDDEDARGDRGSDHPKKRTKISRACDVCRRKKVRCDAVFSPEHDKVTTVCQNCVKHGEECTFSRIPMKRGPTKGYVRDKGHDRRDLLLLMALAAPVASSPGLPPPAMPPGMVPLSKYIPGPPLISPGTPGNGNVPIKLPPIFAIQSPGQPVPPSPQQLPVDPSRNTSPPLQGPFWKVPYEMPIPRAGGASGHSPAPLLRRKLSVDLVSTASSRGPPGMLADLLAIVSDSDDDYYSLRLNPRGPMLGLALPRNLMLLLLLLNGRIKKVLLAPTPVGWGPVPPPPEPLDANLRLYYQVIHPHFPILTTHMRVIQLYIELIAVDDERLVMIAQLFAVALTNLIHFKTTHLADHVAVISRLTDMPCLGLPKPVLILFFATFVMVNYSIFLAGDNYLLGIGMLMAVFHDFKVMEYFRQLVGDSATQSPLPVDFDNVQIMLPKLVYLTHLIDTGYALGFGTEQNGRLALVGFLHTRLHMVVPPDFLELLRGLGKNLQRACDAREQLVLNPASVAELGLVGHELASDGSEFCKLLLALVADKYALYSYCGEMAGWLARPPAVGEEELGETLGDFVTKLVRLTKQMALSIAALAAHMVAECKLVVSPWLHLAMGQLFKMIKFAKMVLQFAAPIIAAVAPLVEQRAARVDSELAATFGSLHLLLPHFRLGNLAFELMKQRVASYAIQFGPMKSEPGQGPVASRLPPWLQHAQSLVGFVGHEAIEGWY